MHTARVGVDNAKNVFHIRAVDRHDGRQWQAKLTRAQWLEALVERVPSGAMEAFRSALIRSPMRACALWRQSARYTGPSILRSLIFGLAKKR